MSLLMSNMIAPFFFLSEHVEAWVVLGTALVTGAAFIVLTAFSGFSRLLGFGHLPWVPMLVYLIVRFPEALMVGDGNVLKPKGSRPRANSSRLGIPSESLSSLPAPIPGNSDAQVA